MESGPTLVHGKERPETPGILINGGFREAGIFISVYIKETKCPAGPCLPIASTTSTFAS